MEVYHNPEDDKKELKRLEMMMQLKTWLRIRWEEIKSLWSG